MLQRHTVTLSFTMERTSPAETTSLLRDVTVDDAIMACIPRAENAIVTTTSIGDSSWSRPLQVTLGRGTLQTRSYFVKITKTSTGMSMLRGEYESMAMLHSIIPQHTVTPIAWGTCSSTLDHYFYVSSFHEFGVEPPTPSALAALTASFHTLSAEAFAAQTIQPASAGRFGFHTVTHMGMIPQEVDWTDSWEAFFARDLRRILAFEAAAQGQSKDFESLAAETLNHVVPRLIRPLETEGRSIRPTLIHGDLQIRNFRMEKDSGSLLLFDAGSFWGHNECDLGKWRIPRFRLGQSYIDAYHELVPKSEPVEECEDRAILYSMQVPRRHLLIAHCLTLPKADIIFSHRLTILVKRSSGNCKSHQPASQGRRRH
ncbi:hypothetical protein CPLU01_03560 [Colletotrichum plurivorum]|uniref:protein-ribulosamine 3-kinase n=1 Tax=Colletotrichum plurivorum TaxID=2175906 RepID=A0A8H6KT33_9PEZI|nr:hypothetical protein CPLU01_03560 [Colletotrichum plurivorum]